MIRVFVGSFRQRSPLPVGDFKTPSANPPGTQDFQTPPVIWDIAQDSTQKLESPFVF